MKAFFLTLLVALGVFSTTARLESDETPRDPIAWIVHGGRFDNTTIYNSMIRTLDISALRGKYRVVKEIDYSKVQDWDRAYFVHTKSGGATIYEVVKCYIRESYSGSNRYFANYSSSAYGALTSPDTDDLKNTGSDMARVIAEHYLQ